MSSTPRRILVTGGSGFIGTRLVEHLLAAGDTICNLDAAAPNLAEHTSLWQHVDMLDADAVRDAVAAFGPTHVVHLAARVDTDSPVLNDYRVNFDGTANLLAALVDAPGLERLVITSTQFVMRPGRLPVGDDDVDPHTAYGESKVLAERLTREADLPCTWTIVRPTNIWGPWHPRYPSEFWKVLEQGRYLHPRGRSPIRCYGYVANVVEQIESILAAAPARVHQRMFYLGDAPAPLEEYVFGFARALTGKPPRTVPYGVLKTIALAGDAAQKVGVRAPLTSSRLHSMTEDYPTPMGPTFAEFGAPSMSLADGIAETVEWLRAGGVAQRAATPAGR